MMFVQFYLGDRLITWYIGSEYIYSSIFLLSCLSTFAIIHGVVWYRKKLNLKRLQSVPRSGDLASHLLKVDLSKCVEVDVIYEVVNPELKRAIQNLIKRNAIRILLDTRIVIAAATKLHRTIPLGIPLIVSLGTIDVPLLGVFAPLKSLIFSFAAYGAAVGGLAYSIMHYLPILVVNTVPGAGTALAAIIIALGSLSTPHVHRTLVPITGTCEHFIRPVPSIDVIDNSGTSREIDYIDVDIEYPYGNVYFYDSEHKKYYNDKLTIKEVEMKLYIRTPVSQSSVCENKQLDSVPQLKGTQSEISVKETCTPREYKYVPLSERTMRLADLDQKDSKVQEIIENAQYPIDAYERSSYKFAAKRIKEGRSEASEYLKAFEENRKQTQFEIDQLFEDFE